MESLTKNRQPLDVLRAMVARCYGSHRVPTGADWVEELGHGWFNVAYRIRLSDGEAVVLKIAPPAGVEVMTYERDMMRTEVRALGLVRDGTSVPVPDVHGYDDSHELCDADYFFMPYVDAENLGLVQDRLSDRERRGYGEALGSANRELNGLTGPHFGAIVGGTPGLGWRAVFGGIVADVLTDGERRGVDLGWDYDVVRSAFADDSECLDEVTDPAFVEWDLWDSNVLVRDGTIVSIIDHERALYGDPIMEAGFVATALPAFGDSANFLRGYGKPALDPAEQRRRRLYNLHLTLIMVIETVYRGHTEPTQYDWARAQLATVMADLGR